MFLVIPSITIQHGKCVGTIAYPGFGNAIPAYENPVDRARLLRKENAKALHLIFREDKEWTSENLKLISSIREAVDIPIEISLLSIPDDMSCVKQLLESGIYRLFLPHQASDYFVSDCISDFSRQKIAITLPIELAATETLARLKNDGAIRIGIVLHDSANPIPLERLGEIISLATGFGLRLSLLSEVHSYSELMQVKKFEPGFDSIILGSTLEKNVFPCQGIWREAESTAFSRKGAEVNLWENPLRDIPHI
jgi:phosphoribosylformimino-5-aminoimidazole carboxamide ribonucleotide (ProFAR) isomerase